MCLSCSTIAIDFCSDQGMLDVFAEVFRERGLSAVAVGAADNFLTYVYDDGEVAAYGFIDLVVTLRGINAQWIADFDNPTRVVVVGHSHGVVWAHTAIHVLEQEGTPIPIMYLVDIDGVSIGWETESFGVGDEWGTEIPDYSAYYGLNWPYTIENAENSWRVPGLTALQDTEDVVPSSVLTNLEIGSNDATSIRDTNRNHRRDGSTRDIFFFMSGVNHESTDNRNSDAVRWASGFMRTRLSGL